MNEQANMQLVQQAYQFFRAGNVPSFLNLLAEDVLWQVTRNGKCAVCRNLERAPPSRAVLQPDE